MLLVITVGTPFLMGHVSSRVWEFKVQDLSNLKARFSAPSGCIMSRPRHVPHHVQGPVLPGHKRKFEC